MRKREAPRTAEGVPVMPRDVLTSDDWRAKNVWFREHGLDPGDWAQILPVLEASETVHGAKRGRVVGGSLERMRHAYEEREQL